MAVPGGAATLPLRYLAVGALGGVQASFAALTRTSPASAGPGRRSAAAAASCPPASGRQGDRLEEWSWRLDVDARTTGGHYLRVGLDADGHPGYLSTSRMLGEAGLLLSEKGSTPERGGCLTPAAALGTDSHRSLQARRDALLGRVMIEAPETGTTVGRRG